MTGRKIVKTIMAEQGIGNAVMADRLKMSPQSLWDKLNNKSVKDINVVTLCKILTAIDYDLVVVPRGKASRIDGAFIVTNEDETK